MINILFYILYYKYFARKKQSEVVKNDSDNVKNCLMNI